jgi:alpha-L-fucosidase
MNDAREGGGGGLSRRAFVRVAATAAVAACVRTREESGPMANNRPRPTPSQLEWQRDELAMFLHFGVNVQRRVGRRRGSALFAPSALDASQWARAARDAGFRAMILTAKHHDGFCLWPTATTRHSVASSPFRGGHGDVVREFVDACRAEGLKPGLYLSPWDRNNPAYGDSARYNTLYIDQLTELLTHYGQIAEFWFDGANGEGPNGRSRLRLARVVDGAALQPTPSCFRRGPDVRWCGNERMSRAIPTGRPSILPSSRSRAPTAPSSTLQHGDPAVWRPGRSTSRSAPAGFITRARTRGSAPPTI